MQNVRAPNRLTREMLVKGYLISLLLGEIKMALLMKAREIDSVIDREISREVERNAKLEREKDKVQA